jgi:hypothetical protein
MTTIRGAHIEHPAAWEAARKAKIIANAQKTWRINTERADEIEDALHLGRIIGDYGHEGYKEGFMGSMAQSFDSYGKLSPKQCEAILKGIDARAAKKAEWASQKAALDAKRAFVGTVGEKITLTITTMYIVVLDGVYGTNYIYICEDADKNVIIYKGTASNFPLKGETATIKATVKEHGVRDGVKQTVIQRPKIIVDTTI